MYLLSFCLLAGAVRQRFWICALNKSKLCKCGCKGRHTIDSLFAVVAWSVRALIAGEYPARDHLGGKFASHSPRGKLAGKPLPMRGAVLRKFGDWAWFKQALGLRGHQGEGDKGLVCWLCRAGRRDPVNYCWNFEEGAAWRSTGTSMRDFWEEQQQRGAHPSPIWQIPGFMISYCVPDFMHVCCLGILQYLTGNVLFELFREVGGTMDRPIKAVGILQNMIKLSAKAIGMQKSPVNKLTRGMFCTDKGKPKMRAKAAQGRYFLKVLHYLLGNLVARTTDHAQLRYNCVSALLEVYNEMEVDTWKDDGSSSCKVADKGRQHLLLYCELRRTAASEKHWRMYPKHHLFDHSVGRCVVNPRLEWNYLDEAEMGIAAVMASVSNQQFLETNLVERYRVTFKADF